MPAPVAGNAGVQRLRPAAHRPIRLRRRTASASAAARSATAASSTTTTSSATRGQVGYNLTLGSDVTPRPARRLPAVHRRGGPAAQLERLGRDHRPRRTADAHRRHRQPSSTRRAFQQQSDRRRRRRSTPSIESQSFELNDTIRWKNWTFNVGLLASNDTLYGQGLREDASTLSGFVAGARATSTRCTRSRSAR